jgi:ribonucleotide reductase beta subunit family protein with ferritin-like domain
MMISLKAQNTSIIKALFSVFTISHNSAYLKFAAFAIAFFILDSLNLYSIFISFSIISTQNLIPAKGEGKFNFPSKGDL